MSVSKKPGRPRVTERKVYYAQRLPKKTIDQIKALAKQLKCSEASAVAHAVQILADSNLNREVLSIDLTKDKSIEEMGAPTFTPVVEEPAQPAGPDRRVPVSIEIRRGHQSVKLLSGALPSRAGSKPILRPDGSI